MTVSRRLGLVGLVCLVAACGEPTTPPLSDGGPPEMDGGAPMDAPETPTVCTTDDDCIDDTFCDGEEACAPGATDADENGCVAAADEPCDAGETCDEAAMTCDAICPDADGDGHGAVVCGGDDCDDGDANRYPGRPEVCDGTAHDEDCNAETFGFLDGDSDGAGAATCCNVLDSGDLGCGDDCNDSDATVNSRAGDGPPLFCDGVDNDCSGTADEGCPCVEGETQECGTAPQLGRVGLCRPGTNVCSGGAFTETCIGAISPTEELCDGLDNDCDAMADEGVLRNYFPDVDGDGFGEVGATASRACSAPDGYASNATDCDDTIASVNPGATEVCNAIDDNCFMGVDEGFVGTFFADVDRDGFGDAATMTSACSPPAGYVRNSDDCDDTRAIANPAATEICNTRDEDCDGTVDESVLRTFYRDMDADGVGGTTTMTGCTAMTGYVTLGGDCDDANPARFPGRYDACNGVDDDCNGTTDPGCGCTDGMRRDCGVGPGGGMPVNTGECAIGSQLCVGGGWGSCVGDVGPTTETCDMRDEDCDGTVDESTAVSGCYGDADGDGYGVGAATSQCRDASRPSAGYCPPGYTTTSGDCNDANGSIRPMAVEACNGTDDNCSGTIDEGTTVTACLGDGDGDAYGAGAATTQCRDAARMSAGYCPPGFTTTGGDCNDANGSVRPMATETCNGTDDNCSGAIDEGTTVTTCLGDGDGDGYGAGALTTQCRDATRMSAGFCPTGYTTTSGDCNDANGSIRPGATETCNGTDDNCAGGIDEGVTATGCYADADADTYGIGASTTQCRDPARMSQGYCPVGYTNRAGDCNDASSAVRPMAAETCNGRDDDCSGTADDGAGMICVAGTSRSGTGSNPFCASVPGTYTCSACTSETFTPSPPAETCNALDDDCDGTADDAFACVRSSTGHGCVTGCGTNGTRSCSASCSFTGQACTAAEVCNGCDDDGVSGADNGFACVGGSTRSCTRTCGAAMLTGSQRCLADCSGWSACTLTEVCNGCDDDGDGSVDNGFTCAQNAISYCTTSCGTAGQLVCNATCSAYTAPSCRATAESCNYCDDDGDGSTADDRPLATLDREYEPGCPDLSLVSTTGACPGFVVGNHTVRLVNNTFSDAAAVWVPAERIGWGSFTFSAEMRLSKSSAPYLPADGWAIVIADGGTGTLGGVGGGLGVPMTRTGLAIEWRFYSTDPNVDQVDTITVRRLTGSGSGTVLAGPVAVPAAVDFGAGDTTLTQRITATYTPDDPATLDNEERLVVSLLGGAPLLTLTGDPVSGDLSSEIAAASMVELAITAGTGGRTFTADANFRRDFTFNPLATYVSLGDVCY